MALCQSTSLGAERKDRDPPREEEVRKEAKKNFLSISRAVRFRDAAQVIVSHTLPLFLFPTDQPGWAASTLEVIRNCQMDRQEECQGGGKRCVQRCSLRSEDPIYPFLPSVRRRGKGLKIETLRFSSSIQRRRRNEVVVFLPLFPPPFR